MNFDILITYINEKGERIVYHEAPERVRQRVQRALTKISQALGHPAEIFLSRIDE